MTGGGADGGGGADRLNATIARRISNLRKARRLSFDQLAALSGASKGMLVQLEQGRANPSIASLCRIAAGLKVSVAELVSETHGRGDPVRIVPAGQALTLWRGPKGGRALLLVGSEGPDMLELWDWELRPGERFEAQAHPGGTLELITVVKGTLSLEVPDVAHRIEAGGSALARTDARHAYACVGRGAVHFTMAVAEWGSQAAGKGHGPRAKSV